MSGTFVGIGVGPGDPSLITLKALEYLQKCPVIAYPAPVGKSSLALSIAQPHIRPNTDLKRIDIPMVTHHATLDSAYDQAAETLSEILDKNKDIGYICEGDPLFYGSFIYLMQRLQMRYKISIIPGISSIMAGASIFQQALTQHNQHLRIIPGTLPNEILYQQLIDADIAVIMKVGRNFEKICAVLKETNHFHHSHYVAYATMENEFHCPLAELKTSQIPYFSLIYVIKPSS